jgi:hypothetical protein
LYKDYGFLNEKYGCLKILQTFSSFRLLTDQTRADLPYCPYHIRTGGSPILAFVLIKKTVKLFMIDLTPYISFILLKEYRWSNSYLNLKLIVRTNCDIINKWDFWTSKSKCMYLGLNEKKNMKSQDWNKRFISEFVIKV